MSVLSNLKKAVSKATGRRGPRLLTVKKAWHLTPTMIRVTFAGPELADFPVGNEGGHCKLLLPEPQESRENFADRLSGGPPPVRRTYTVRHYRADSHELDVDFVAHGDNGPASRWASHAAVGDFLGFMGPSGPKIAHFEADWYLVAADLSALPMAAATLEAMPRNATGTALFEITSTEDQQEIQAPEGIDIHWLVHSDSQSTFLQKEKQIARKDMYISGYWKIGLVEDEHQKLKRTEA